MTILVDFRVATDRFALGRVIAEQGPLEGELERVVPTENLVIPYVWVSGETETLDELTASLESSVTTESVKVLDKLTVDESTEQQYLYRIEWDLAELDIIKAIVSTGGVVLEGRSLGDEWNLRFRFADHQAVADFYKQLTESEIREFSIESIYELKDRSDRDTNRLSDEQHEALLLAAQRGYFEIPRAVTLGEIGDELGISQQAVSERIRRATRHAVFESLNIPIYRA